jgi:hypothetical protein
MHTQAGERYQCSDPNCGCEIQVLTGSRADNASGGMRAEGRGAQAIGGPATGETGVGSLRNAETGGTSTPGDFGSQGATGEGVFGTSGGNQRSTSSGRLGSSTGGLHSGATGTPASAEAASGSGSGRYDAFTGGEPRAEANFSCCCGQPMRKNSGATGEFSRSARA